MTRTVQELMNRIKAANFEAITVTMKCNGDEVVITPCSYEMTITDFSQIDFYLMDSPTVNLCGGSTLEYVADVLCKYAELIEEDKKAVEALKAHICKYGERSDWDFVSDYHKDIFGHRPHVTHAQLIAWAHSTSTNSARHF